LILHYIDIYLDKAPTIRNETDNIKGAHLNCYVGSRYSTQGDELWSFETYHQVMVF
jgi:hypothetical protein